MAKNETLTPEQLNYIKAHINYRPRIEVARAAGCSVSSVYRVVHKYGGIVSHELARRNPEYIEIVRKHYPDMSGHEVDRRFNLPNGYANRIAKSMGIKHTDETIARMCRERNARFAEAKKTIDFKKRASRWKAHRRLDEWRVEEGKPQRTKFLFSQMTRAAYKAKHHLMHHYGYLKSDEPYTLIYNEQTKRRIKANDGWASEAYYTKKYHLQFMQEKQQNNEQ